MKLWSNDRFNELKNEVYDIIFGSDYTANRDIYEVCSKVLSLFYILFNESCLSHIFWNKKTIIHRKALDLLSHTLHFPTCMLV